MSLPDTLATMEKFTLSKIQYKKGAQKMYTFLNTPDKMAGLIASCDLALSVGMAGLSGSAQIFGEDSNYPDLIHFYPSRNPRVTDPYRLFMIESKRFKYKEII